MVKWDGVGEQCTTCGGRGRTAIICEGCDYPEDECVCTKEEEEDE